MFAGFEGAKKVAGIRGRPKKEMVDLLVETRREGELEV